MDMDLPVVYGKYSGAITSVVFFFDFIPWRLFEAKTLLNIGFSIGRHATLKKGGPSYHLIK